MRDVRFANCRVIGNLGKNACSPRRWQSRAADSPARHLRGNSKLKIFNYQFSIKTSAWPAGSQWFPYRTPANPEFIFARTLRFSDTAFGRDQNLGFLNRDAGESGNKRFGLGVLIEALRQIVRL